MVRLLVIALFFSLGVPSLACVNTSYSRAEDSQLTSDATRIIAGHFPEHGDAFYLDQVERNTDTLQNDPRNVEARNDLAVALLKLQRFEEAEKELLQIEREDPGLYRTHANLGVLYKKTGEFAKAADHTREALRIKPEGHLGLGDYYLRMLDWRAREAAGDPGVDGVSFLGTRYDGGTIATTDNPLISKKNLLTLIKADRHFAPTYFVLGDLLFEEEDLQNAARAYLMASRILATHPGGVEQATVEERLDELWKRWALMASVSPDHILDPRYSLQVEREFYDAERWLANYQQVEAELVTAGQEVDFAFVEEEMRRRGYPEPIYTEAGFFRGKKRGGLGESILPLIIGLVSALLIVLLILSARTRLHRRSVPAEC